MLEQETVKTDKKAFIGTMLGVVGNYVAQLFLLFIYFIIFFIIFKITSSASTAAEIQTEIYEIMQSPTFLAMVSIVSSSMLLGAFVIMITPKKVWNILKNIFNSKAVKYALVGVVVIILFSFFYNSITISIFNLNEVGNENQVAVVDMITKTPFLAFFIIVILAPLVEEFAYRYSLFGGLLKKNKILAYIVSAFVFMAMHAILSLMSYSGHELVKQLIALPPYAFSGLVLCYIYDKSGYLGSSILAHVLNNLIGYLLLL